jgi:hypothetical protein
VKGHAAAQKLLLAFEGSQGEKERHAGGAILEVTDLAPEWMRITGYSVWKAEDGTASIQIPPLDPGMTDVQVIAELLKPYDAKSMLCYPVSLRVNHSANDFRQLSSSDSVLSETL